MSTQDPTHDERKEEEENLIGIRERIERDIEFVGHGVVPANWQGCEKTEILERLRRHHANVCRAIEHVRTGGALTDIVPIIWGTK